MDDLISLLKNCVVNPKKFDEGLDELISNLKIKEESNDESNPNEEWDTLSENYSKLKHLHRLINFHKITIFNDKFKECLILFLR